jgi:hypothetical protein
VGRRPARTADQADVKLIAGDFLPDLPDHGSPGLSEAINVYPGAAGYRPVGQFYAHTDALPSVCKGAAAFIAPSGRVVLIAGTATKLFVQDGVTWTEIGTGYTMPAGGRWRFVQFGEFAIASNHNDPPVKINLETDAVANLGGSPPDLQALGVVGNFVVGTQVDGQVNKIAWSGENNSEWWTAGQRKSDYNEFPDGGEVTGIISGDVGLILQRNVVRRMAYVGGNVLFRFDKISSNDGCASVHTVAQHGDRAFWYSDTGFKMWDGAGIHPIGQGRVDESFAGLYEIVNLDLVSTAIDAQRSTVCWSTGYRMWLYNWLLIGQDGRPGRWTIIDHPAEIITQRATRAPSLEEQDPVVGAPDDDVDEPDLDSFDAARFRAGDPVFYTFSEGVLGTFNGANMEARFTDRSRELVDKRDTRLRRVRPLTDATEGLTLRIDARQRLGDTARRRDFTTLRASGEMPVRNRGRFIKSRLTIAADQEWSYYQGLDDTSSAGGSR